MDLSIIIPAYNEAPRLGRVLAPLATLHGRAELIVIDDGSTDATGRVASEFPGVRVIGLPVNRGKGAALRAGVLAAAAELVVFVDADLRGFTPAHVERLAAPLRREEARMAVGLFRGGRGYTDFSHWIAPWVSGQRALFRADFLSIPDTERLRFGIEARLTRTARVRGWPVRYVALPGVCQSMKEEKLGIAAGLRARWRMYREMFAGWRQDPGEGLTTESALAWLSTYRGVLEARRELARASRELSPPQK